MASTAGISHTVTTSSKVQDRSNPQYHNFLRVLLAVSDTVAGLKPCTVAILQQAYDEFIAKMSGVPPPCKDHDGKKMAQLLKCSHCAPWAQALQQVVKDAGENPKKKNWTVNIKSSAVSQRNHTLTSPTFPPRPPT